MDRSRTLAGVALVALLLLAGCQAPGTPDSTEFAPDVTVVNASGFGDATTIPVAGNGSVDPGVVFTEVQTLLDSDVPPPIRVRVLDDLGNGSSTVAGIEPPFRRHMNVTRRGSVDLGDQENGAVNGLGSITIYPGEARDPQATTWVLAHELVHYVQVRSSVFVTLRQDVGIATTDGRFTYRAMLEGPAVYTTEAYLDEYYDETNATTLDLYRTIDAQLPPGSAGTYANRQYLVGYRYVRDQVDSPAELDDLYDDTAVTSEQLLHGLDPAVEPMAPLSVAYDGGEAWSLTGRDRLGEAFLWTAFEDHLGTERAREAAAGWGNDSLLTVYPTAEGNASFAWVLRWDDAANATEFATAARTYLDRAATGTDGRQRLPTGATVALERPGDRTTVLLVGEREFVDGTTIERTDAGVSLSTG